MRLTHAIRLLALLALGLLALPAAAHAARDQEAMFQDDNHLIYTEPAELRRTLDTLAGLGVDRLRITILWQFIAPQPASRTKPQHFDARNPDAYPPGVWDRFDRIVAEARLRGMDVNFNVTGPAPLWATKPAPRDDILDSYEPSPAEFRAFVTAVGLRYSGNWPPTPYALTKVPRVDYWSVWNEPNHSGWLTPTWASYGNDRWFERSASLYRELLDAAWAGLADSGHGTDTILIGETAPTGDRSKNVKRYMKPMIFLRALYCVNRKYRPLKGPRARRLGCAGRPADFRAAHPALFGARGYAHHPYQLLTAPHVKPTDRDYVTMGVLRRLPRGLDRIFRAYGSRRHLPVYLTEYGYQTRPDPLGVGFRRQAAYLNRSEFMAWRDQRVKSVSQFLLYDDGDPVSHTFQSGLLTREGKRKPAFRAYRLPIHAAPKIRRGRALRVWGVVRAAPNGKRVRATVQFRRKGAKRWVELRRVRTVGARGSVWTRVRVRRSGHVRLAYRKQRSRAVRVRVVR